MGAIAQTIVGAQGPLMMYAEKLLTGVTAGQFARQPVGKDGLINTNHPAFIFGHMSVYAGNICELAGIGDSGIVNPDGFEELFSAGSECRDDPDGSIYPAMEKITGHFFDGHRKTFAQLAELSDEQLAAPHGQEGEFFQAFPSRAAIVAFLVGPHPFTHLGQMSVWRRCMGLGSVF